MRAGPKSPSRASRSAFCVGAPLCVFSTRLLPLAAQASFTGDTLFLPFQFVAEILPYYLGDRYRYDARRARLDEVRGQVRPGSARPSPRPDAGAAAQRPPPGPRRHDRSGPWGCGPRKSRHLLPARDAGEGCHPAGRAAAARRAQAAGGRRPDDPHHRHPDRAGRPRRLLYRGVRSVRQSARQFARRAGPGTPTSAATRPSSWPRPRPRTRHGWPRWKTTRCGSRPRARRGRSGRRTRLHPQGPPVERAPPRIGPRRRAGPEGARRRFTPARAAA